MYPTASTFGAGGAARRGAVWREPVSGGDDAIGDDWLDTDRDAVQEDEQMDTDWAVRIHALRSSQDLVLSVDSGRASSQHHHGPPASAWPSAATSRPLQTSSTIRLPPMTSCA